VNLGEQRTRPLHDMTIKQIFYPPAFVAFGRRLAGSELASRLASGAFWSLIGAVATHGMMLLAFVFVAWILGQASFGQLGMVRSTVSTFGTFAGFGLGLTATRYLARYRNNDPQRAGRILALAGAFTLATGVLAGGALFVCAPYIASGMLGAPQLTNLLRVASLLLALQALDGAHVGALGGLEAFKGIALASVLAGTLSIPVILCCSWFGGLTGAVWGLTFSTGTRLLMNHVALRWHALRVGIWGRWRGFLGEWHILWQFSIPVVISGIMVSPASWLCKASLVNRPDGFAELGIFEVAEQWRMLVLFAPSMVMSASLPVLSQLYGNGQFRQYRQVLLSQFLINAGLALVAATVVAVVAEPLLRCYGPEFSGYGLVVVLAMAATVLAQMAAVAGLVIHSIGTTWWGVALNFTWALIYVGSAYYLTQSGALGLATALLVSYGCHFVFSMIFVLYKLHTSEALAPGSVLPCET